MFLFIFFNSYVEKLSSNDISIKNFVIWKFQAFASNFALTSKRAKEKK